MLILKEEDEVRCKKVVFVNSLLHESISKRRHHPVGRQMIAMDEAEIIAGHAFNVFAWNASDVWEVWLFTCQ